MPSRFVELYLLVTSYLSNQPTAYKNDAGPLRRAHVPSPTPSSPFQNKDTILAPKINLIKKQEFIKETIKNPNQDRFAHPYETQCTAEPEMDTFPGPLWHGRVDGIAAGFAEALLNWCNYPVTYSSHFSWVNSNVIFRAFFSGKQEQSFGTSNTACMEWQGMLGCSGGTIYAG